MTRFLLPLCLLAACQLDEAPLSRQLDDARALGRAELLPLIEEGSIVLDLADARDDQTVVDDARTLLLGALDGIEPLDFDAGHRIELRYLGRGDTTDSMKTSDEPVFGPDDDALEGFDAYNLATGNEFSLVMSADLLAAIGRHDAKYGLDLGTPMAPGEVVEETKMVPEDGQIIANSWSNSDDDRYRRYGQNASVTYSSHRRLVQLGTGCSGALVGPRHVVTAGHCLWNRENRRWSNGFSVRAGANGTNERDEVLLDRNNIPSGQSVWYYTPSQYRSRSGSTWGYDYGILVLPGRIGDTVGWMGRVTLSVNGFNSRSVYRRGYPLCEASIDGEDRIDVPATPCSDNHLYANQATCSIGEYQSQDSSSWSRIIHHSCDASAGDSGSALYVTYNGSPAVAGVHFSSRCGATAESAACTGSWVNRPLGAIRLTPSYRDQIGSFRSIFP